MNNPNYLSGGEKQSSVETGYESNKSFEEHMEEEGLNSDSDQGIIPQTEEEKAAQLEEMRSAVLSQYDEKLVEEQQAMPKQKREKLHNPNSEEVTRDPGTKAMSDETVRRGNAAKLAMTKTLNQKLRDAEKAGYDDTAEHVENVQDALVALTDGVYPDVIEPGEGTLGKLQVVEKSLSKEDYSELLGAINGPVMESYKGYEVAVKEQLEKTQDVLNKERSHVGSEYLVRVNGKEVSSSFSKGAEEVAKSMLTVKHPDLARRTPSEVLAQEDEDNRLRSDGAKTLEAFRLAVRDKKIEPTSEERKVLDQVSELERICNQLDDNSEAQSMCFELRKDLNNESGTDFSKAVKMLKKLEKQLQKQEKKLQKQLKKIDFSSLQSRVNAVA